MTNVRRPQGGNTGKGPQIEGQTSARKGGKKTPVQKLGKGGSGTRRGY